MLYLKHDLQVAEPDPFCFVRFAAETEGAFRRPNAGFWRLGRQKPAFQNKRLLASTGKEQTPLKLSAGGSGGQAGLEEEEEEEEEEKEEEIHVLVFFTFSLFQFFNSGIFVCNIWPR